MFNEPMKVVTTRRSGGEGFIAGLIGQNSGQFREVTFTKEDIASLTTIAAKASYHGDAELLRPAVQAYSLGIAHEFDPYSASPSPELTRCPTSWRRSTNIS